ncbi:MAG: hypothetical protein CM15mP58_19440 [Burkholderiaceae bacterium]|nr:MAG: hypothetical protein CM15mP58_19440 [Burkholderiaceae bacterium]
MKKFLNKIIDGRDLSIEESFDVMNDLNVSILDDVQISAINCLKMQRRNQCIRNT